MLFFLEDFLGQKKRDLTEYTASNFVVDHNTTEIPKESLSVYHVLVSVYDVISPLDSSDRMPNMYKSKDLWDLFWKYLFWFMGLRQASIGLA